MVRSGAESYVLVVGVEQLSRFMDPTDRGTAFIFADGAGRRRRRTVGGGRDRPDRVGLRRVAGTRHHPDAELHGRARPLRRRPPGRADGGHRRLPLGAVRDGRGRPRGAAASPASAVDDLDAFIPHQANLRITQTLARNIKLPDSVAVATDVVDSGNTSAASVPLAMEAMLRHDEASAGDTALLIAFGAGLSYAGQVVTLPPLG